MVEVTIPGAAVGVGMTNEAVYHVVCHDCVVESVRYSEAEAADAAAAHAEATDHDVSVGRIA